MVICVSDRGDYPPADGSYYQQTHHHHQQQHPTDGDSSYQSSGYPTSHVDFQYQYPITAPGLPTFTKSSPATSSYDVYESPVVVGHQGQFQYGGLSLSRDVVPVADPYGYDGGYLQGSMNTPGSAYGSSSYRETGAAAALPSDIRMYQQLQPHQVFQVQKVCAVLGHALGLLCNKYNLNPI